MTGTYGNGRRGTRSAAMIGALGLGLVLLAVLSVFYVDKLPIIGAGTTYTAEFREAAGLKPGNEVRIAGVKVGKVSAVTLNRNKVIVSFRTKDAWIGDETTASIQIKTLLGQKFLALDPKGDSAANPSTAIPLSRTVSPYDVVDAFSDLSRQVTEIDTGQLVKSFEVLSETFAGTPQQVRDSINGVARLSAAFGKRDAELRRLFAGLGQTSAVLANRNAEFEKLIANGGQLLAELNLHQQAIRNLLAGAATVGRELSAFVHDNEAQIGPALTNLNTAIQMLNANQANITKTLQLAAPFYGIYASVLGNGRWFDSVIVNLIPPGLPAHTERPAIRTMGGGHP